MERETLDDEILKIMCIADQIGAIAFCAANTSFDPNASKRIINDILYGIENLSKVINDKLDALCSEVYVDE